MTYGHWGSPVLVFPSEAGRAWDFENNGMVDAVRFLLDAGRLKLYCVDSADDATWSDRSLPLEERAARHDQYERWVLEQVVPYIHDDCGGLTPIATLGCSLGAFHAANIALRHAHVFPRALCLSGSYDPRPLARLGRPRRRLVLPQPHRVRGEPARRPPRLAAPQPAPDPRGRAGRVGGRSNTN